MPVYEIDKKSLKPIKEVTIGLEKTIQTLVENSLEELFGLKFIQTEFPLNNLRIDTLAFDENVKSFVIIEYKRDKNLSVIDQGYAYLALLLNNKADFVLEYNEKFQKNMKKGDVDWSQSRVLFVSTVFTRYQKEAMAFRGLPIELWEVKLYENDLITFNELTPSEKNESIKTVSKDKTVQAVTKEIKNYSEDDFLKPEWKNTKELYEDLSQQIQNMDERLEVRPVKYYIGFHIEGRNLVQVVPQKTKIQVQLMRTEPKDLRDPEGKVKYMNNSYTWYGQHVSVYDISSEEEIDYAMMLIRQLYKKYFQ